ncbi:MAG: HAD family phosphatase [archaeon]|jgi:HAD superfamily hydrolase (TIGR01509 family)
MIKAIIFDRDGVLIDSEMIHKESIKQGLKKVGFNFDETDFKQIYARSPDHYKEFLLSKYPVDWEEYRKIQREFYYSLLSKNCLVREVVELAKVLKEKGYKLGIATSTKREVTTKILEDFGIRNYFDEIVGLEDTVKHKPNPDPYLKAAELLKVNPKHCLVLEDSVLGLTAAKAAGMKCLIIKTNVFFEQDYSQADLVLTPKETTYENIKYLLD